jgi:hypothetical protein
MGVDGALAHQHPLGRLRDQGPDLVRGEHQQEPNGQREEYRNQRAEVETLRLRSRVFDLGILAGLAVGQCMWLILLAYVLIGLFKF